MKLLAADRVEDCFDGSSVYRFELDAPWTRDMILALQTLGAVDYHPDFPRPFFQAWTRQGLIAKGVEGSRECRVILPREGRDAARQTFEQWLQSAGADAPRAPAANAHTHFQPRQSAALE
ncbi:MAG TPA: hypothetical protein P5137_13195 [Candidatus Brocadiia bacterium]|nr:hypothetical protein [Candidatus Brocadiia bacterium]